MLSKIKPILKAFIPPIILNIYKNIRVDNRYGFFGNYSSWEAAQQDSIGYNSDIILDKVRDSLLKVKTGEAIYERDSVLFDKIQYSFPVLAGLLRIVSTNGNKLSVLDFGGSLGSHYYQNKQFLSSLDSLKWSVVEQENFVKCGKQLFKDEHLKFYFDTETCWRYEQPDVILISNVLQYLHDPHNFLKNLVKYRAKHIIFDKTPFIKSSHDQITIQKVPPAIYDASYPAWFFNKDKFLEHFEHDYKLVAEFYNPEITVNIPCKFKGFIFELIDR